MNRTSLLLVLMSIFISFSFTNHIDDKEESSTNPTKPITINWISIQDAIELNKTNPKKVIVDVVTNNCYWCKKMDKATYQHPEIVNYINEHFYAVKLNAEMRETVQFRDFEYIFVPDEDSRDEGYHEMAFYLTRGRLSFPSVVFLDELMNNPQPVAGYKHPVELDKLLRFFGENYYENMDWYSFNLLYPELQNKLKNATYVK